MMVVRTAMAVMVICAITLSKMWSATSSTRILERPILRCASPPVSVHTYSACIQCMHTMHAYLGGGRPRPPADDFGRELLLTGDDLSDAALLAELDQMEDPLVKARRLKKEIDAAMDQCKALVQQGEKQKAIPILREKKLKEWDGQ